MRNGQNAKSAPNLPNLPNFCTKYLIIKEIYKLKKKYLSLKSWARLGGTPKKLESWASWASWAGFYTPDMLLKTTKIFLI